MIPLARACSFAFVMTLLAAAGAQDTVPGPDDAYPLRVQVGDAVPVCATGTIVCPAASPICDDPSIAVGENTAQGLVFRGLKPGTTLCSAQGTSGQGARRLYLVIVTAKP